MTQQLTQDHRLLKGVVIGLGLLIVLGFGALVIGLATKGGKVATAKAPVASADAVPLILPKDASIADMTMSERQLVLRVTMAGGEELVLIDLPSGRVVQRIPIKHAE
jgi:hypothetical protein